MNLVVIIPTCNRHRAIEYLLYKCAWNFKWYGIDLVIYDSSDNDKTEAIVENYIIDGCDNITYKNYYGEFDGFSLDHKLISAYREYYNDYEYIWICRDGIIITINGCYDEIFKWCKKKYDCIVVDSSFRNGDLNIVKSYESISSAPKFFREQAVRMVTLGTIIFSSSFSKKLINNYPIDDTNYSLWQMIVPFYQILDGDMKAVGIIGNVFEYNPVGTLNSFWNKAGKAFEQWVYRWHTVIDNLPNIYDNQKNFVLKIEMYDFHPFYLNSLIRMRANGGLNIKLIKKYEEFLPKVSNTSLSKFYIAAIMPKFIAKILIKSFDRKMMIKVRMIYSYLNNLFRRKSQNEKI